MNTPPDNPDNNEPFLARWSRRKRAEQAGQPVPPAEPATAAPEGSAGGAAEDSGAPRTEGAVAGEEEFDLSTLPNVDELEATSDFTAFLDKRVPAALRNAALGRMWTLDPTIRDFIEVAEYQWDWNAAGGAPFFEPLEGGAEMAERIVQGLGSAVRSVAEAASPKMDDATLVEDALVGRADVEHVTDVAPHHGEAPGLTEATQEEPRNIVAATPQPGDIEHAALQRSGSIAVSPRRRHGGALPA